MSLIQVLEILIPAVFLLGFVSQYCKTVPGIPPPDYPNDPIVPWPGDSENGQTTQKV